MPSDSDLPASTPLPNASFRPAQAPLLRSDFHLWRDAPAWRNLLVAALAITTALAAMPLIETGTEQATSPACQGKALPQSHVVRRGQIVGFLSTEQANNALQYTQSQSGMTISPEYVANLRSLVHLDGAAAGSRSIYLVPQNMTVRNGDRVEVIGGRLDPNLPCHYIPNIITRDLSR
jgi:hypothetical protein